MGKVLSPPFPSNFAVFLAGRYWFIVIFFAFAVCSCSGHSFDFNATHTHNEHYANIKAHMCAIPDTVWIRLYLPSAAFLHAYSCRAKEIENNAKQTHRIHIHTLDLV